MSALREGGQVAAVTVLFMTALLGMTALVLDVGSWFREDRRLQATADAAALAGAQLLPEDPAGAIDVALEYADKNGGGVAPAGVEIRTAVAPNDEIAVESSADAPGFFSKLFDVVSVRVGGKANARSARVSAARWVAPIAVDDDHPLLLCEPDPCFGQTTELPLANLSEGSNASGSFGLVRLNRSSGSTSTSTLGGWIRNGYDGLLQPGLFPAATGAKFNSSEVQSALQERIGDELLFPVYRSISGSGTNAEFDVVGWVGFTLESFRGSGSTGSVVGRFTRVTWDGVEGDSGPDYGVRTVLLTR